MAWPTYEVTARFCMVSSLLLFIALFVFVIFYVLYVAQRDQLDKAQRTALDLGHKRKTRGTPS